MCTYICSNICFILRNRFLSLLELEIYNPQSPIWREDFNQTPESLAIPSPVGSSITPTTSPAAGPPSNISRTGYRVGQIVYARTTMFI